MFLIKITDPVNDLLSVDCCTCACGKNLLFFIIIIDIPAFSFCIGPAKGAVIIACIIHFIPVMKLDHPGLAGKSFLMSSKRSDHLLKKIRFCLCIIVQKQHIWRPCCMDSLINCPAETIVLRELDHVHPGIFCCHKSTASVCRSVIYQYYFKIIDRLSFQAGKNAVQICHTIKVRYHYRYFLH